MLDLNKYKVTIPFPSKQQFTTTFYYKAGKLVAKKVNDVLTRFEGMDGYVLEACVKETVFDDKAFRVARTEYNILESALYSQFKIDLFADAGVEDNEFTKSIYDMAWEDGHSAGLYAVENKFNDLVDLVFIAQKVYGK